MSFNLGMNVHPILIYWPWSPPPSLPPCKFFICSVLMIQLILKKPFLEYLSQRQITVKKKLTKTVFFFFSYWTKFVKWGIPVLYMFLAVFLILTIRIFATFRLLYSLAYFKWFCNNRLWFLNWTLFFCLLMRRHLSRLKATQR